MNLRARLCLFTLALLAPACAASDPDPTEVAGSELASSPSFAARRAVWEAQPSCGNFVRFDDRAAYTGFGPYRRALEEPRQPIPGTLRVAPLDGKEARTIPTSDSAMDAISYQDSVFVLTYSGIEELTLDGLARRAIHPTTSDAGPLAYKEHARSFARYGDVAIIAHGRLGLTFFDLRQRRLVRELRMFDRQRPLESMITGVTVFGRHAYAVVDSFSLVPAGQRQPFRGIVIVDMETMRVTAELDGLDPGADAIAADDESVVVSFGGIPIWRYRRSELRGTRLPEPERRSWTFPERGHPIGAPLLDGDWYFTCFLRAPEEPGGQYVRLPRVLDRRAGGL